MKRSFYFIILMVLFCPAKAEIAFIDSNLPPEINCENAQIEFQNDLKSDSIKIFEAGAKPFSMTYKRLMYERYKIVIVYTNLFGLKQEMYCYNKLSLEYIKSHFGDSIYMKTKIEANELDRIGKGDRMASFGKFNDSINGFFYQNLDPVEYEKFYSAGSRIWFTGLLLLNKEGELTGVQLYTYHGTTLHDAIEKLLPLFPYKASPQLKDGQAVPSTISFSLALDKFSSKIYKEHQQVNENQGNK